MPKRNVVIFCDLLLPPSMTFIRSQGEALKSFVPYYLGCRGVQAGGLSMPDERTLIINPKASSFGKLNEIPLKVFGYDPRVAAWLRRVGPEILHAHFGPGGTTVLPISQLLGLPLIVTFHGYDVTVHEGEERQVSFTHRRFFRRRAALQRHANRFIAVSDFVRQKLSRAKLSRRQTGPSLHRN